MAANVQGVIMLLGDSITEGGWDTGGFAQRLALVYARKLDVINRGLSGYTTRWAIPVFKQCFPNQHEQQHVPKHVPLSEYIANLHELVQLVKSPTSAYYSPETRIILITPPPISTVQRAAELASRELAQELDRDFEVTRRYAEAAKEVASKEGVAVVDVWTAMWEKAGRDERKLGEYLSDGLHLNAAGYTIVYEELIKTIEEEHNELHYDELETVYPLWSELVE